MFSLLDWWRNRKARLALLAHQAATGHRGIYKTFYSDGSSAEHCVECEFGLPEEHRQVIGGAYRP